MVVLHLTHILIERRIVMSVADAIQLMLSFGTFIVALIALIVELIKNQSKK
ncbi:putative holin-like toxin [Lactobacillus sp. ESL0681]|uniref:putative holin-like toxin n=1 Tax=Lactobacillus sp. ESL0681 TaxID=2983211 RepID=UPI0023F76092|nr:putative holin-like toxin [Lactobacillus sp. ESL0681]WEV41325.1 putative holin-like toxin [Lactobacillus sp. ESL0681]